MDTAPNPRPIRNSWEVKSVIFILRCMAVLAFLMYLMLSFSSPWHWAKTKWIRQQPADDIVRIAEESLAMNKPEFLLDWITARPAVERAGIMEKLQPLVPRLSPFTFATYANWMDKAKNTEEAVFWQQYMLYRLRFDTLRCGTEISDKGFRRNYLFRPVSDDRHYIQRVLDYDAKWPANNDPLFTCMQMEKMNGNKYGLSPAGPEHWKSVRFTLRTVTENSLSKMAVPQAKTEENPQ